MENILNSDKVTFLAPAKLNLSLDVKRKLDNGYHEMEMIMQAVSIYDEITLEKNESGGIKVECDVQVTLKSEENIAYKAAEAFFDYCNITKRNITIKILKQIPSQAGMGGGSADAAAVIVGLNKLYDQKLTLKKMMEIGETVGADVPFCLHGKTALVQGIGDIITQIDDFPDCYFVVAKPVCSISTKEAFKLIDNGDLKKRPNTEYIADMIRFKDIKAATDSFVNVFEEVTENKEINEIKKLMCEYGGMTPIMTGSGSAVFCTFLNEEEAVECYYKLSDSGIKTYVCNPIQSGPVLKQKFE